MNPGWRFHLGDIPFPDAKAVMQAYSWGWAKSGAFQGAALREYDDTAWRALDLPHDWVMEGTFDPAAGASHGYLPSGVAWYRKTFVLPAADAGRRMWLEFDGVFRDSTVYFNGHRLGHEPSGYTSFRFDISDFILPGEDNVVAVRVDAREGEGWWYEGAGIYRNVWLVKLDAVHVAPWGVQVAAEPRGQGLNRAAVEVITELTNDGDEPVRCGLRQAIEDAAGNEVATEESVFKLGPGDTVEVPQALELRTPQLWSVDEPYLYRLRTEVTCDGREIDAVTTPFGVRSLRFDADKGFFLNGKPLKLKGASNHQDHAGVGVAVPARLFEFRVARLKEMGANAWRCAHNPPAPEFLDACDRLGMLVMDETRCMNSTPHALHQLETMVRRDRNHPCVMLWSLGNEEFLQTSPVGARIIRRMKRLVQRLDPTRPVTLAMNGGWGEPVAPLLDIMGCNYAHVGYDDFHKRFPTLPMFGSETSAAIATRGEYTNAPERGAFSAYDVNTPGFGAVAETGWKAIAERDFMAGTFPWTGFDYRGEPAPYEWPCVSSNFGIVDTCGFPKDTFYYYQAWWSNRLVLHLLPHWTWPGREGETLPVWCHTNCDEVELFLNGTSQGRQAVPRNGHAEWKVAYAPGTLKACGLRNGKVVAEETVETAGAPVAIRLAVDRPQVAADGEDVAQVVVSVVDAAGRVVPYADQDIFFTVTGPGKVLGTGNGNPASHEPDKAMHRRVFHGLCVAFLQPTTVPGTIEFAASAAGMTGARLAVASVACTPRPNVLAVDFSQRLSIAKMGTARSCPAGKVRGKEWMQPGFADGGWSEVMLGSKPALPSPSCVRIRFVPPADLPPERDMLLDLGPIHDFDETWLNGVKLGSVNPDSTPVEKAWLTPRRYAIPRGLLKPGAPNVIAIRAWNSRTTPDAQTQLPGPMTLRPAG